MFGLAPAIVRVDLRVEVGETVLVRGANGAGKSTLLRLIATAISPTYGAGCVLGWDLVKEREEIRRRTELLGHRTRLYELLNARENLSFACSLYGIEPAEIDPALERVGLREAAEERVSAYSHGMRQRLAVARAMMRSPELVLLDEPYAGLDAQGKDVVDDLILRASAEGRTVVIATHDPMRGQMANRRVDMENGRIVSDAVARASADTPVAVLGK